MFAFFALIRYTTTNPIFSLCVFVFLWVSWLYYVCQRLFLVLLLISMFVKQLSHLPITPIHYSRALRVQFVDFSSQQGPQVQSEFLGHLPQLHSRSRIFSSRLRSYFSSSGLSDSSSHPMTKKTPKSGERVSSGFLWGYL